MPSTPATRGAFRPLRLTSFTLSDGDRNVSLSPLDVSRVEPAHPTEDGRALSCVVRRNGPALYAVGTVADVTLAWQRALRADDTPSPCEWELA